MYGVSSVEIGQARDFEAIKCLYSEQFKSADGIKTSSTRTATQLWRDSLIHIACYDAFVHQDKSESVRKFTCRAPGASSSSPDPEGVGGDRCSHSSAANPPRDAPDEIKATPCSLHCRASVIVSPVLPLLLLLFSPDWPLVLVRVLSTGGLIREEVTCDRESQGSCEKRYAPALETELYDKLGRD